MIQSSVLHQIPANVIYQAIYLHSNNQLYRLEISDYFIKKCETNKLSFLYIRGRGIRMYLTIDGIEKSFPHKEKGM